MADQVGTDSAPSPAPATPPSGGYWGFAIPRAVLRKTALLSLLILVPLGVVATAVGPDAALGLAMGVLGTLTAALKLRSRYAAMLAIPVALTGAVGLGVAGQPLAAGAFAALACLLIVQGNLVVNGLLTALPTIAAVFTCMPHRDIAQIAGWMVVGGLLPVAVLHRMRRPTQFVGIPLATAWRHAAAMALLVGPTVYLVNQRNIGHGYWLPMTMTVVLRPYGAATIQRVRQRVVGTLAGALLAVILVLVLPVRIALLAAAAMMFLMLAYGVLGRYSQQVLFMTPFMVLIGAGGLPSQALDLAALRVGETLLGVLLAGLAAIGLARYEAKHPPAADSSAVAPAG